MLISRLALDIGRAAVSIALNNRQSAPATVAPSHDNDVMEQVDSVIEAARRNPALADIFSHPQARPGISGHPPRGVGESEIPGEVGRHSPCGAGTSRPEIAERGVLQPPERERSHWESCPTLPCDDPGAHQCSNLCSSCGIQCREVEWWSAQRPPAAASAPSATSNAATPRSGRRAASHFTGKTDKEKAKAARDRFNDPDAT